MEPGEWIVRASVWLALLCYPAGPFGIAGSTTQVQRVARIVWTLGCAAFVVHVVSSFDVFYGWSHGTAWSETARHVEVVTGRRIGAGIYLNYLFTVAWVLDVAWWWLDDVTYRLRSRIGVLLMHGFFLFMIFCATVVFGDGATRIMGLVVTALGAIGTWKALRRRRDGR